MTKEEAQALTTKEAKRQAIEDAESVEDLDVMAEAWIERGHAREGLLIATVIQRKCELGHEPTDEEEALMNLAAVRLERAKDLPPITGRYITQAEKRARAIAEAVKES